MSATPRCVGLEGERLHRFIAEDWGRRPVLFRGLLPSFESPLSPDELAGLACTPGVEARIVQGIGDGETDGPYTLQLGPFQEDVFETLPETGWTLLVNEVNRWVPDVAALMSCFDFVGNYRHDDVMVSYASTDGSVGAHVDNYDVWLVQGAGKRRWRTAYAPIPPHEERLVPGLDVRVLQGGFVCDEDWVLEPGDALYVPPRVPHYGTALDDQCMTYSVGFRAPTLGDVVAGWTEHVVQASGHGTEFFGDDATDMIDNLGDPGRISTTAVDCAFERVMRTLQESSELRGQFDDWFARAVSQPKRFREVRHGWEPLDDDELYAQINRILSADSGIVVRQQEGSVFTYFERDGITAMYIDGEKWEVEDASIAAAICGMRTIPSATLAALCRQEDSVIPLLEKLLALDLLYIDDGTECVEYNEDGELLQN